MIHLVFNRPTQTLKVFAPGNVLTFAASGDAWGNYGVSDDDNPPQPPYGHCCAIAPGHYRITAVDTFDPIASEGAAQIHVDDIDSATARLLLSTGHASLANADGHLDVGGVVLPVGGLASNGNRQGVMLHGGGSNLGDHALDAYQELCRTFGCTRLHNADLATLVALLQAQLASNTVVFSVIGDPKPVAR